MSNTINTSRAKKVEVNVLDYDNIAFSLTYTDSVAAPIDLTNYKFKFVLESTSNVSLATYEIPAGTMSTAYLSKGGTSNSVLDMENMFEDIRDNKVSTGQVKLIQIVTNDAGLTFVHIVYRINANKY